MLQIISFPNKKIISTPFVPFLICFPFPLLLSLRKLAYLHNMKISLLLRRVGLLLSLPLLLTSIHAAAETERDARMQWWRDAKFGMFIHYGLYSGLAGEVNGKKYEGCVEWIQQQSGLDSDTYVAQALPKFTPKPGCAKAWIKLAQEAGCKYAVLTSKHHEGFALFDSKASNGFNSKATKNMDIVKEFAEACRERGLKTGYYYSLLDWHHPDYDGKLGKENGLTAYPAGNLKTHTFGHHDKYKKFMLEQVTELVSNYGEVDILWWDFSAKNFEGDKAWGATDLVNTVRGKHPGIIMNNRLYYANTLKSSGEMTATSHSKGDFSTPEQYVPEKGVRGDWEACMTLNGTWGYSAHNQKWKTETELIRELAKTVSQGGNYLLNIGPMADGSIPQESIRLFKEIGKWLNTNGEAIYGTVKSPFNEQFSWGVVTQKGQDLYLIIFDLPQNKKITLPYVFKGTGAAIALADKTSLPVTKTDTEMTINVEKLNMTPHATVVKLTK